MINLFITMTGKSYNPKDEYRIFASENHPFANKEAAMKWCAEHYGKSWKHRAKMFVDTKDGQSQHIGYIVGFKNDDVSSVEKWLQKDWIEFQEVTSVCPE